MGAFLDKPKIEKHNEKGKGNNLAYALSSMQGWRVEMEDAHSAHIGLPGGYKDWSFFGVFDGHAGAKVSMYSSEQLIEAITTNDDFRSIKSKAANGRESKETHTAIVKKAIRRGFLELDNKIRALPEIENGEDKSGTTVTSVMLSPTHIYFANCGDSRAVLSRNGKVAFSTQDHKPTNPAEKERIQNAGGSVMIQRVNGALAVSRALGDFEYKNSSGRGQCEQLVSPEPDIHIEDRVDADEFLVLACDGIWDVMSNEEVCDFVRDRLQVTSDLVAIANLLIDTCLYKGSKDNMSVILVTLPGSPKESDAAKKKDTETDERLESIIRELFSKSPPPETNILAYVMQTLMATDVPGLPPGGGLHSKRHVIQQIIERLTLSRTADNSRLNSA